MNFAAFWNALRTLQNSIAIVTPVTMKVKRSYWGAPSSMMTDLPAIINAMTDANRMLGLGVRRQERYQITVQLLAGLATPEDERTAHIATEFWFAAKDRFDADPTLGGVVVQATLQGATPTVPVVLTHGGKGYIGFDALLDILHVELRT